MIVCLRKDVLLVAGTGNQKPVDLLVKITGTRIPLSTDEAAIAMLLIEGAEESELLELARQHRVGWTSEAMSHFVAQLADNGALDRLAPEPAFALPEQVLVADNDAAFSDDDSDTQIDADGEVRAMLDAGALAQGRPQNPTPAPLRALSTIPGHAAVFHPTLPPDRAFAPDGPAARAALRRPVTSAPAPLALFGDAEPVPGELDEDDQPTQVTSPPPPAGENGPANPARAPVELQPLRARAADASFSAATTGAPGEPGSGQSGGLRPYPTGPLSPLDARRTRDGVGTRPIASQPADSGPAPLGPAPFGREPRGRLRVEDRPPLQLISDDAFDAESGERHTLDFPSAPVGHRRLLAPRATRGGAASELPQIESATGEEREDVTPKIPASAIAKPKPVQLAATTAKPRSGRTDVGLRDDQSLATADRESEPGRFGAVGAVGADPRSGQGNERHAGVGSAHEVPSRPAGATAGATPPVGPSSLSAAAVFASVRRQGVHRSPSIRLADGTRPLAIATVAVRDGRFDEAKRVLVELLSADPKNEQARVLLEIVARVRHSRGRARRILGLALLTALVVVVGGVLAAGFLVRVPRHETIACKTGMAIAPPVTAPVAGRIRRVDVKVGDIVEKNAPLLTIDDEEATRQRRQLGVAQQGDLELLEIMKTGGTEAHERRQRDRLTTFQRELAHLGQRCRDVRCKERRAALEAGIEDAKNKLKFCEWRAYPREVKALEGKIAERKRALATLRARQARALMAPQKGLVLAAPNPGSLAKRGQTLIKLAHRGHFWVSFEAGNALPAKGTAFDITITHTNNSQTTYRGEIVEHGGMRIGRVETDVSKLDPRGGCSVRLVRGDQPLLKSWLGN